MGNIDIWQRGCGGVCSGPTEGRNKDKMLATGHWQSISVSCQSIFSVSNTTFFRKADRNGMCIYGVCQYLLYFFLVGFTLILCVENNSSPVILSIFSSEKRKKNHHHAMDFCQRLWL